MDTPNTRRLAAPALAGAMRTRGKLSWRQCVAAAGGMLIALGAAASPALADPGYTLNLSAPSSTAVVGQTMIIQASGFNPPDPIVDFSSYLTVVAIPTSVLSACPADYASGKQVAMSTSAQGGEVLDEYHREDDEATGNFSMPVAYVPSVPGRFLLCGYTDDAATTTLATASLVLDVVAAGAPGRSPGPAPSPDAKPASLERPRVKRSGKKLVCRRGSWSNTPTRYSYGWLVNGRAKRGASGQTLRITRKLRGRRVQCTVRASNAAGATIARSRPYRA
jgi:hypothetical protein